MAKKQQKYICINSYIYAMCIYISINHFKSLCGKTIVKKHHRAQDRKQKRRTSNSSYTPLLHCRYTTLKQFFCFQNIIQNVQICFCFQYKETLFFLKANPLNILQNVVWTWNGDASQALKYMICWLVVLLILFK